MNPAKREITLFDLDRTLLDTELFLHDMWQFLALEYGVDSEREMGRAKEFYRYHNNWYDYDFFGHLASNAKIDDSEEMIIKKAHQRMQSSYLFEDASLIFAECDRILTFGSAKYQNFKLSFAGEFSAKPADIILEEKADFIARKFADYHVTLIDDKPLQATLPKSVTFIRIDRRQLLPLQIHSRHFASINSLRHFEAARAQIVA